MARKGKFGRSAAGSQNLSALVYSLLKEERQAQEDTMLTAYRTNMTSGTAAGTFTSGGSTTAATANAVRQWYLDQASAAAASGDTVGASRFRARAEEFRVSALADMERVLDRAYEEGNGVDLALFGLSGTDKITASIYEQIMQGISNDPSMTTSDKQRMQGKIYTVSYDYANEQMVNGFNEGKYTAAQLVAFYDKELKAATAAGLTETSKTYRAIQSARSSAIARNKNDIEAGRQTNVDNQINDEVDAMAKALQKLMTPVIENYTTDKSTQDVLKQAFGKGGGRAWFATFSKLANDNNWDVAEIYRSGATVLGLSKDDMDQILRAISDTTKQIQTLQGQGYAKELGDWPAFIAMTSDSATDGLFAASSSASVLRFSTRYGEVGGNIAFRGSGDPSATADLLNNLAMEIGGYSPNNVTDSGKKEIITKFAKGDLTGLFTDPTIKDVNSFIQLVQTKGNMAGASPVDIAADFAQFLHILKSSPDDAFSLPMGQTFLLLGGNRQLLQETITTIGGFGTFTTADVLRLALESSTIPALVKATPGYVMVYDYDPKQTVAGRSTFTHRVELAANVNKENYALTQNDKGELYYARVVRMDDQNTNIGYVAVPGGGNNVGDTNDLIIIRTDFNEGDGAGNQNPVTLKLTVNQLVEYSIWLRNTQGKGGDFATPYIKADGGISTLVLGQALKDGLLDYNAIARWAQSKGGNFLATIKIKNLGGQIVLNDSKLKQWARAIFDAGIDSKDARSSIQKWLKDTQGIDDTVFNYTDAILKSGLAAYGDGWSWRSEDNEFFFNMPDPTQDRLPPAPAGVDPNATASTDPQFGMRPSAPAPTGPAPIASSRPNAPGASAGVGASSGTGRGSYVIPTSDLLEHTLRNIGPSLRPGGPTIAPEIAPGVRPPSTQPTIDIEGERGSGPQARGLSIPTTPPSGGPATIKRDIRFGRRAL
jgi:hypothetical protein